jgi:hypothetical protein
VSRSERVNVEVQHSDQHPSRRTAHSFWTSGSQGPRRGGGRDVIFVIGHSRIAGTICEIGVRMALGAAPARVRSMILRQVAAMTIVGGVLGTAAAVALGRFAEALLFQLKGWDPAVLSVSVVLLAMVALGAGFIPALRASQIEPMRALRYE